VYPIAFSAAYQGDDRNRLTTFFRLIVAIPWFIVMIFYGIGAFVATVIAWFALLLTGKYPQGLYDFNAGFIRMSARVSGFYQLLTDEYPSFGGGEDPEYPIRTLVGPPKEEYSRMKVLFRIILLIPVYVLHYVMQIILEVCGVVAWLVILFTGKLPIGLYRPIRIASAYSIKGTAFYMLMTEDFPPFWQDEEEEAPRFGGEGPGISAEPTTGLGL
jgi:hypothetical protein